MPRKGNLIKHIMVLKSILPSVRDPFRGEEGQRGSSRGQVTMVFPPGHCPVALPLLPTSGHGLPSPLWSDCSCRWSCRPPAVQQPWHHGPTSQSPDTSSSPLFPRNSQEPHSDRKPFTLSKNPGPKMQWPQPLLLCQISGTENNCEQFNSLDLASFSLPVKVV